MLALELELELLELLELELLEFFAVSVDKFPTELEDFDESESLLLLEELDLLESLFSVSVVVNAELLLPPAFEVDLDDFFVATTMIATIKSRISTAEATDTAIIFLRSFFSTSP